MPSLHLKMNLQQGIFPAIKTAPVTIIVVVGKITTITTVTIADKAKITIIITFFQMKHRYCSTLIPQI